MYLLINTARQNEMQIALSKRRKTWQKKIAVEFNEAEKLLPLVDELLKKSKSALTDLKAIFVVTGPGPFTSLRIGITVANTLAYSLNISVLGFKTSEFKNINDLIKKGIKRLNQSAGVKFVYPHYGLKPNITKPKKKW